MASVSGSTSASNAYAKTKGENSGRLQVSNYTHRIFIRVGGENIPLIALSDEDFIQHAHRLWLRVMEMGTPVYRMKDVDPEDARQLPTDAIITEEQRETIVLGLVTLSQVVAE